MSKLYSIVVLISGSGSNLQAIIDQIEAGKIKANISAVISNRADAYGLERAKKAGIPTSVIDHTLFSDRNSFDNELKKTIDVYEPDLIVLAGFMRILSDNFVESYQGKLINIHPALLPKYKGLNTHERALEDYRKGLTKEHGASVHFVIPELDAGKVLIHGGVPILEDDDADSLAQRVHKVEHIIYPTVVQWLAHGNLKSIDENVFFNDEILQNPKKISLKDEISK